MDNRIYHFSIPEIPDCTHYKYTTTYEGSIREHIFLRAEHLLRMVSNFKPGEMTVAIRIFYRPDADGHPQDRIRLSLSVKTTEGISSKLVNQIIRYGPLAEFYDIVESENRVGNWKGFRAVSEVIRFEESLRPSGPPDLDIHKLNKFIPEIYYCIAPFKPRTDNDFLMLDRTCSFLNEPVLLEIMIQPTSQQDELDQQYREIIRLMAVNSYSSEDYIVDSSQLDPFKDLYEPNDIGEREIRAKDPMADEFLRNTREFHKVLRSPQLLFNIKAWATTPETAHQVASTAAECAFSEGCYRILDYDSDSEWFEKSLQSSVNHSIFPDACFREIWASFNKKSLFRLAHMTSVDEFKGMFRLPVAGFSPLSCFWKSTDYHRKMENSDGLLIGHALNVGDDDKSNIGTGPGPLDQYSNLSNGVDSPVTMPINILTKHLFLSGVPGSGKTTAVLNILLQLFKKDIPFLVIEPGKTEYRRIKMLHDHPDPTVRKLAKTVRVYTPGKDDVSPFRFNPFQFPEGITTDEHIAQLLVCFEASMPLGGPLQALIAESIESIYKEKQAKIPTMTALVNAARQIMLGKGYAGEVRSNLSAALEVRLSSLTRLGIGKIFQCENSTPAIADILKYPTIIEIQNLNAYQACLFTFFLLSAIWEEIRINRQYTKELKHVTVIEEAHNIVGKTDTAKPSEEFADPQAYAAEYVVRMLAEIRALGEGIVIADQLPSAVASSVVKNTGTKLAHRLVSIDDREVLGGAMLLQGPQMEEIARLQPGQAYYYSEGLYAPRQIVGLNAYNYLGLDKKEITGNQELSFTMKNEGWFEELKKERNAYLVNLIHEHYENLMQAINNTAVDLKIYADDFQMLITADETERKIVQLLNLRSDVIKTRTDIKASFSIFANFVKSLPKDIISNLHDLDLKKYRNMINGPIQKMNGQASDLDNELENLRVEISNFLLKGRRQYETEGD